MSTTVRRVLAEKGSQIYAVGPDDSIFDALERMAEHNVGALVVLADGALVGIISERDYARKMIALVRDARETRVRDLMSSPVFTVDVDDTVATCMGHITAKRFRHLPVLDHGALVGVVSVGDMVKAIIAEQAFEIEQLQGYISGSR